MTATNPCIESQPAEATPNRRKQMIYKYILLGERKTVNQFRRKESYKSRSVRYLGPPFIKDNLNVQDLAELLQQSETPAILMVGA
jgi:hypothetical protein